MADSTHSTSGIGFAGLLTVVLITLKLLDIITWSWVWVLAPLWISFLLWVFIACFVIFIIAAFVNRR